MLYNFFIALYGFFLAKTSYVAHILSTKHTIKLSLYFGTEKNVSGNI